MLTYTVLRINVVLRAGAGWKKIRKKLVSFSRAEPFSILDFRGLSKTSISR